VGLNAFVVYLLFDLFEIYSAAFAAAAGTFTLVLKSFYHKAYQIRQCANKNQDDNYLLEHLQK
jgi:hypothetical protein